MSEFTAKIVTVTEGGMVVKYTALSGLEQSLNLPLPIDENGTVLTGAGLDNHILTYAPVESMSRVGKARLKWGALQALEGREVGFTAADFLQGSIAVLPAGEILVDAELTKQ